MKRRSFIGGLLGVLSIGCYSAFSQNETPEDIERKRLQKRKTEKNQTGFIYCPYIPLKRTYWYCIRCESSAKYGKDGHAYCNCKISPSPWELRYERIE